MAGIGFTLRKFSNQDNLLGLVYAYGCSAIASTGPWILTVMALGSIIAVSKHYTTNGVLITFRSIIIYNFSFSLVLSGPILMIATRTLADAIHNRDATAIPGMLIGSLMTMTAVLMPTAVLFYCFYAHFSALMTSLAIINFLLIGLIWLTSIFISSLKNYKTITFAYIAGLLVAILASCMFAKAYGDIGMLCGFNVGLTVIIAVLLAQILTEYPYPFSQPFMFLGNFRKYWRIAAGGFIYNAAIWIDKWIMWFSPDSEKLTSNLRIYSTYDSAMFFAYMSIVPSLALFLFSMETGFFEHYQRFYRDIQNKVPFAKIEKNHQALMSSISVSGGRFLLLQASIAIMAALSAPQILHMVGGSYMQIAIFRFGILGAFCHVMLIFMLIMLSYFDSRRETLLLQATLFITNTVFTLVTLKLGFSYYGYGYFMACFVTMLLAAIVTYRYVVKLPYHTFITSNSSL